MTKSTRWPRTLLAVALALAGVGAVATPAAYAESDPAPAGTARIPAIPNVTVNGQVSPADSSAVSAPAAQWTASGSRLDLVVRVNSTVQQTTETGGSWSPWFNLDAPSVGVIQAPSISWTPNGLRLDVFVEGADHNLYQKYWLSGKGWTGWNPLGAPPGGLGSSPAADWANNSGRIDVFAVGSDGHLYQKYWTSANGWTGWGKFDAVPQSGIFEAPTISWSGNGTALEVFVTGWLDNRLYQMAWNNSQGWKGWFNLDPDGGSLKTGPSTMTTPDTSQIQVFGIGTDNKLHQKWWTSAGWSTWHVFDAPPVVTSSPPSATWPANASRIDIFVTDDLGTIWLKSWTSAGWSSWD